MKIQNHFAGNPFAVKKFNFIGGMLFALMMLLCKTSFSQKADTNKILTVTYCFVFESNDTTQYSGYYRETLEKEIQNDLLAMGNLHVIPPEPANKFDSVASWFLKGLDPDTIKGQLENSREYFRRFAKNSNLDGVVFISSTKIPIYSPAAENKSRAVFILRSFLFDFANDTILFDKRRLAIGNEWTILHSDLRNLFLDTIRSDYHETPKSELEGPRGGTRADGRPSPSLSSVPDAFDSVFSVAMNNHDFNSFAKYYNEDISYNVYSYNECSFFDKTCDSCRSFYILNYYPLDRKPNQHFNKINFLKCVYILEEFIPLDTLNSISYPTNLHETTFLCGITDFCKRDSMKSAMNIPDERPMYIWAINALPSISGLKRAAPDFWIDGSKIIGQFYSDIYNPQNLSSAKKHNKFIAFVIIILFLGISVIVTIFRIRRRQNRNIRMEKRIKENKYVLHIDEKEYEIFMKQDEKKWEYFMNLINHPKRKTGVEPGEVDYGPGGVSDPDYSEQIIDKKTRNALLEKLDELENYLKEETDYDKRMKLEEAKNKLIKELSKTTYNGKIQNERSPRRNQKDKILAAIRRIETDEKLPQEIRNIAKECKEKNKQIVCLYA